MYPMPARLLVATLAFLCPPRALAEIFRLGADPAPGNWTLNTLYFFYIYNHADAPDAASEASVKFANMGFNVPEGDAKASERNDYHGLQLSIIKYEHFWDVINPKDFCCKHADVLTGRCEEENQLRFRASARKDPNDEVDVYEYTVKRNNVPGQPIKDHKRTIRTTGVYVLVLSNCGDMNTATVSGDVVVTNPFGFLPGNEYHKLPFYMWLSIFYFGITLWWMLLSLRFWKELFNIQNCISVVIMFGLLEAFLWYLVYHDWNNTGTRSWFLFILATLFSVGKSIFSYMLVLVASLGWGITRPYLDRSDVHRIQVVCFVFIVLDFTRRIVMSFRHSRQMPGAFIFLCLVPNSMLNGAIFYWVFSSLTGLMENLASRRQSDKLKLFENLWRVLVVTLVVMTISQMYEFLTVSRSVEDRWKSQWVFAEGVSHLLFVLVLLAMMCLWAPHKNSMRYAYSAQVDDADKIDKEAMQGAWAEEDLDDGDEDETFWASTQKKSGKGSPKGASSSMEEGER